MVFGYFEPPPDIDPEDVPDQRPVASARDADLAQFIADSVNCRIRSHNQG